VVATLFALEATLARCGYPVSPGTAVGAVHTLLSERSEHQLLRTSDEVRSLVTEPV
jgi:hypothetical protein